MQYISTRGKDTAISDLEVLLKERADDGGLYVPAFLPKLSNDFFKNLIPLSFAERVAQVAHIFLPSLDFKELKSELVKNFSEKNFRHSKIAKLEVANPYSKKPYFFDCSLGNTGSIKDISQQFAKSVLPLILKHRNIEKAILLNTSTGNQGASLFDAFKNDERFLKIVVFPKDLMNEVQRYNLSWHKPATGLVVKVDANFFQCQNYLKGLFQNLDVQNQLLARKELILSTQSYTWISILPLIALIISLYVDFLNIQSEEQDFNLALTDGHLGELLGAYYAKMMGVSIKKIICASNRNKGISDFFRDGVFNLNIEPIKTNTPALDLSYIINLERLIFEFVKRDGQQVSEIYESFLESGEIVLPKEGLKKLQKIFVGGFSKDEAVKSCLKNIYDEFDFCLDPQAALAYSVYIRYAERSEDATVPIYLCPCSPYLYVDTVLDALNLNQPANSPKQLEGGMQVDKANQPPVKDIFYRLALLARETDIEAPSSLTSIVNPIFQNKCVWQERITEKKQETKLDSFAYIDYFQEFSVNEPIYAQALQVNYLHEGNIADTTKIGENFKSFLKDKELNHRTCSLAELDDVLAAYLGFQAFKTLVPEEKLLEKLYSAKNQHQKSDKNRSKSSSMRDKNQHASNQHASNQQVHKKNISGNAELKNFEHENYKIRHETRIRKQQNNNQNQHNFKANKKNFARNQHRKKMTERSKQD